MRKITRQWGFLTACLKQKTALLPFESLAERCSLVYGSLTLFVRDELDTIFVVSSFD